VTGESERNSEMENIAVRTSELNTPLNPQRQSAAFPHILGLCIVVPIVLLMPTAGLQAQDTARVTRDLLALYTFESGQGDTVRDRSQAGSPLDLKITPSSAVRWSNGGLIVRASAKISSSVPASKISDAVKRSAALTIEAWVKPHSTQQTGPARIVSLSANANQRNFTLGQDGNRYDVRLRSGSTSVNGIPSTAAPVKSVRDALTHVVYTRDSQGNARIYVNGKQQASKKITGKLSGWDATFRLSLANELDGDRPWLGEFHLVAVYGRALGEKEVRQNFSAGSRGTTTGTRVVGSPPTSFSSRVGNGLRAFYAFEEGSGNIVHDQSGSGQALDLQIDKPSAVQWKDGALVVRSATRIQSQRPAKKLIDAARRSNATTVEAWVRPANTKQAGPARMVSISGDPSRRNVTLGQEKDQYDARLRTTKADGNGLPSTSTGGGMVKTALTHVVFTRDASGNARIYINGKQRKIRKVAGDLSNWKSDFPLVLANEATGDRPWIGTLHLVAIYDRALTADEVTQNFRAGAVSGPPVSSEQLALARHERLFETRIAPLLAKNCLQCHNSASKKGRLDLSRKVAAMAGGESGKVIIAGNAAGSLLWDQIESGDMPPKGAPLSDKDRKLLRQWIDNGAVWVGDVIDPVIYANDDGTGEIWLQRLTVSEYIQTVRSTVNVDVATEARKILPPDLRADGFTNTAYNLNVDLKHVEAYARLAEMIVRQMDVPKFAARFSKSRSLNTDATARDFVKAMGKWILRGPLTAREEIIYSGIATTVASAGGSYQEGVALMIEAMLQSPRFIYRVEDQRGEGMVSDYELASRLSYILWGGSPDAELMRAADAGELMDRKQVTSQASRMLKDPRAVTQSLQFISDWLDVDRLGNMQPNGERFPGWSSELAADMRQETLSFFEEIVWKQNRPLADLLNAQITFATPRLAKHYGLKPKGDGSSEYDVSKVPARGGLLTQGSVLTIGGDDASMVTRGLFLLKDVLRGTVGDPPPGLDTTPVPSKPGLSQRMIGEKRIGNVACGGCHVKFEPLAFGLERFDGVGAWHETDEYGNKLREDGEILFPGAAKPVKYDSSAELMDLLAGNDRVRQSITWKVIQFALGRPLTAADAPIVRKIHEAAQKGGGTYQELMTAIVTSDLVMMNRNTLWEE
jgi:mono/diheme cytochrome c family protein